jgi:plasmid segregation protein ParM
MFFLLPLVGAAVGAAAGAFATHAAGEKDRQAAKHHRQVANDLSVKYSNLEKRYNEYSEKSKQQINELTRQHALDEAEKDLLRLAIRLQQCLYTLMWDIDESPTQESLIEFEKAVLATNTVLFELKEEFIQVPDKYFSRNLKRANEVLAELSGDDVVKGDIYPIKQCPKCGQRNRIIPHDLRLHPICGSCQTGL